MVTTLHSDERSVTSETLANIRAAQTLHGVPPDRYKVPFRNLRHLLSLQASVTPDNIYMIHYDAEGNREEYSYARFNARVHQAASYLYDDLGVRRGDRVATIAYNHVDTVVLYFACWLIGAAVAPQNVTEDDIRIAYILRNSESVVVFARAEYLERAERIVHGHAEGMGAPNIRQIVQMGGQPSDRYPHFETEIAHRPDTFVSVGKNTPSGRGETSPSKSSFPSNFIEGQVSDTHSSVNATSLGNEREFPNSPPRPEGEGTGVRASVPTLDDEALLVYTSGTTGAPKGVVLTQYNLLVDAQSISQWHGWTGNQRVMCVLPIHHVNGIVVTLITPLLVGGAVVLNRGFSSHHFWERIARERVQFVSVVPTLLQFTLDFAAQQEAEGKSIYGDGVTKADLRYFRYPFCGAGTLAMALVKNFEERFGIPIMHGYGLSETTCYNCFLPMDLSWEEHRHWMLDYGYPSIGCPIDTNEMAIFSADGSGQRLQPGERGEICVRGHNVMKYYYQRPDANAETFKFGWFRTGDEGFYEVDARGRMFLFITGRIKELINRGGVKFSPFDIEEVLLACPGVKVGLAVAFKNDYYGEEVGAYIVPEEGATLDADTIIAHCRRTMSFEKSPKVVVFGTDIPVTTTGKYQRLKLQPLFAEWEHVQFRK
jgi:acyl-CoA synthetase (AMP-forming)/AMP-acid ligase II